MLPDCSREYLLKKILGGACPQITLATSRLRRSIGKFQFLVPKPNPMPANTDEPNLCTIIVTKEMIAKKLYKI